MTSALAWVVSKVQKVYCSVFLMKAEYLRESGILLCPSDHPARAYQTILKK